ncbi:MAG: NlpC/P60 family protein [Kineosporiaceae bacterium]
MTDRATARHRASSRATTPWTTLSTGITQIVGERAENLTRGGAAIAVSSGLMATMALPAHAIQAQVLEAPRAGGLAALAANLSGALESAHLSANLAGNTTAVGVGGRLQTSPLTAPATGKVSFDDGELTGTAPASSRAEVKARRAALNQKVAREGAAVTAPRPAPAAGSDSPTPVRPSATEPATPPADPKPEPKPAATPDPKPATKPATKPTTVVQGARGSAIVSLASRYIGVMYRMGGTSPSGFDCSGLVQYVYQHAGISLPRTAQAQMNATTPIAPSQAKAGDLVFFVSGGYAYHVGIVTSGGRMIDSPRTGKSISERAIFAGTKVYRRVTG